MNDAEVAATMARTFLVEHGNELTEPQAQATRALSRLARAGGRPPEADRGHCLARGRRRFTFRRALGRTVAIL